jgi:hypothetical protein
LGSQIREEWLRLVGAMQKLKAREGEMVKLNLEGKEKFARPRR